MLKKRVFEVGRKEEEDKEKKKKNDKKISCDTHYVYICTVPTLVAENCSKYYVNFMLRSRDVKPQIADPGGSGYITSVK